MRNAATFSSAVPPLRFFAVLVLRVVTFFTAFFFAFFGATAFFLTTFFFVAAFVIAYLASLGLSRGASFLDVFRFVTTAGLLTHCAGQFPGVFWFRRRVAMDLLDGVAYAVATGLIFAALWPA